MSAPLDGQADGPDDLSFTSPSPHGAMPASGLADLTLPTTGAPASPGRSAPDVRSSGGPRPGPHAARRAGVLHRRRARVVASLTTAALVVAVGTLIATHAAEERAWAAVPADVDAPREVNAVQLVLASCLDALPADGPVERVRVVPCGSAHGAQVVGRQDASPEAVWPGARDAVRAASTTCEPRLLGPKGREHAQGLRFVVWAPTAESWAAGDRTSLCLAAADAPLTASLLD